MYAFSYSSIIVQGREILLNIFIIDFIIYFFIFIIYFIIIRDMEKFFI